MSEMVERIARTLVATHGNLDDDDSDALADYREDARAVIAAMREPTDAMADAADGCTTDESPTAIWQIMIDAALKETP
jgi:hypothetical protein